MRNCIIANATDTSIETGINAFDVIISYIIGFDDPRSASITVAYKFNDCYKQQYAREPFHGL